MSKAVVHADAVAGLLVAAALVRPEKAVGMKVSSVKKKLKEKAFAPGVNREEVTSVEGSIGLPLDEFLAVGIEGLQSVAPEIQLAPKERGAYRGAGSCSSARSSGSTAGGSGVRPEVADPAPQPPGHSGDHEQGDEPGHGPHEPLDLVPPLPQLVAEERQAEGPRQAPEQRVQAELPEVHAGHPGGEADERPDHRQEPAEEHGLVPVPLEPGVGPVDLVGPNKRYRPHRSTRGRPPTYPAQ